MRHSDDVTGQRGRDAPDGRTRMTSAFSWGVVDARVVRAMLECHYRCRDEFGEVSKLKQMSDYALRENARRRLGTPPAPAVFTSEMVGVLRERWLPKVASAEAVNTLVSMTQVGLGSAGNVTLRNKSERVAFLGQRNITANFTRNFRKAFLSDHRVQREVPVKPPQSTTTSGPVGLHGLGKPLAFDWYPHQLVAHERLDQLWLQGGIRGRLVLPTGAGKTDTAVGWLLGKMAADDELRVLWLVHQQELALQAVNRFVALAEYQESGFERRARLIFSGASAVSTLAESDLDVAAVTYQSFRNLIGTKRKALGRFLSKPTIVVVDEAHHVGAPSYEELLDFVDSHAAVRALIGLTATPYPAGVQARRRFHKRFPETVHDVSVLELVRDQVLARPLITTYHTGRAIEMTDRELQQAGAMDLPPSVLRKLDNEPRNQLIAREWIRDRSRWGKTLLYATSIDHADRLTELLRESGADARSLHSRTEDRALPLRWFRDQKNTDGCVLVSVGMLTEGVDLPDARTAFLARPTTSPILMRQMVGRVLRGPQAGGEADANVVHFRDDWRNLPDVLHPEEVLPVLRERTAPRPAGSLAPLITDEELLQEQQLATQLERALARLRHTFDSDDDDPFNDAPLDPLVRDTKVVGFYEIDDQKFPVLDHQQEPFDRLLDDVLASDRKPRPFLAYFEDSPPPYPQKRMLNHLVELARELDELPIMQPFEIIVSPRAVAERIRAAGALTDEERAALVEEAFSRPLARAQYRSLEQFEELVERQLRELRRASPRPEPEQRVGVGPDPSSLPTLPRADRSLSVPLELAVSRATELLPVSLSDRLASMPMVDWTHRVTSSSFANWALKLTHANRGSAVIRVNRLLRAPEQHVSDDVLAYLLFHELLHHLLPGQGHDAEFRANEAMWPDAELHDAWLDTLHEVWDTRSESYSGDVARR